MFFILTIIVGWGILDIALSLIEIILGVEPGAIKQIIFFYIVIGYLVMSIYGIKSPFLQEKEPPFSAVKSIDLKTFFNDIYYAVWWPYYILNSRKNNTKNEENKED